ncbi:MAG: TonB-dependent receptor [Chitinophagales bacterium]|nr:TonB-dependent receptor [Chitinophagales bacterium]
MQKFTLLLSFICFCLNLSALEAAHGGTLNGIVVERENMLEIAGATVRLLPLNQQNVTNELGAFSFSDLPGGQYTLIVQCLGFQADTQTVVIKDHESYYLKIALRSTSLQLADVEVNIQQAKPLSTLSQIDLKTRPLNSTQDMLRFVPGLVIAQHAGGGKAEQIFLRGFDIDHGTDIALSADGMPVNMVSHAHGQGYADLHFVIPELVEKIDFQKGPYYANVGNLGTAGYVKFHMQDVLPQSFVKLEAGQFDTYRSVAALDLLGAKAAARGTHAYVAGETLFSNGYFDAPQDFKRINVMGKFRQVMDDGKLLTLSVSHFTSNWLASGQIPERAVRSGLIGRFGAIDPTEGGSTSRTNVNLEHSVAVTNKTLVKNQFFWSKYDFELYSNFTFFLEDAVNGDQIRQKENRNITGYNGSVIHEMQWLNRPLRLEAGAQVRYDQVNDVELSKTQRRVNTLQQLALGDVQELNLGLYADAHWKLSPRLDANLGMRFDQFHFAYADQLDSIDQYPSKGKSIASPKLNLNYRLHPKISLYAQAGTGFHSNDTRVILQQNAEQILPRAIGYELGAMVKPWNRLLLSASAWQLDLEQEFVYVGDAGIVEPSGQSKRQGFDLSVRWEIAPWLMLDADYNYTHPRATEEPEGQQYIPLAPIHTSIGGLLFTSPKGFNAGLRYRYLADRPANEDYSLTADGWWLWDAQMGYAPKGKAMEAVISVQNLANTKWKEAQFETESRLRDEAEPVSEIHYTPGTPFFVKAGLVFKF